MSTSVCYLRVSTLDQTVDSQRADIDRWRAINAPGCQVLEEKASGRSMNRPVFTRLMDMVRAGYVTQIVVWRLDRLGRTNSGLSQLFEELVARKVGFVSLREGVDLSTPAGRMMVGVLSSLASYEREVIGERVKAGIKSAIDKGEYVPKGGKPGRVNNPASAPRRRQAIAMLEAALATGKHPNAREVSAILGVSVKSVYLYWDEYRKAKMAETKPVAEVPEAEGMEA